MRAMQPGSVQTCVTSPPYFGLRDYGHPGQIGLEQTPDAYVAAMVEVFRCVRDVLADDGTLWLNIGDSYASTGGHSSIGATSQRANRSNVDVQNARKGYAGGDGIKTKDLIGIPWMLAFALRADGWFLRQDIIWHKPNPMPESVRDRCTKAHEYVFLLSKSDRYYFDSEAMKEPAVSSAPSGRPYLDQTEGNVLGCAKTPQSGLKDREPSETRNRRSVWTVATRPYKGAHFATYPPALIEPCILAGSRPGDIVLDPFGGSGTTAQVALEHGRRAVLCELNPAYEALIAERIFRDIA
jgi:DNA modification methylase